MIETFESRWRELISAGDMATREVDAKSPIQMVFGLDALQKPLFFVVVENKPGLPQLSGAISVERRQRTLDNRWTLTLVLNSPGLTDVFVSLVSDLAYKCFRSESEAEALATFLVGVEDWQRLLRRVTDRLSEEKLRGLIAELWFGFMSEHHGHDTSATVTAWSGPFGGAQDFNFPTPGIQFEVKAVRPNRDVVEMSSADQLDRPDVELAAVTLDWSTDEASALTLPGVVKHIRGRCEEPELRAEFNRRFAEHMVDLDDPWYADMAFNVLRLRLFQTGEGFPALRTSQLPDPITRVRYRIDLADLPDFLVVDESVSVNRADPKT